MLNKAADDNQSFADAGGKPSDPNHPNRKWADKFWQFREEHLGTEAASQAAGAAIALLLTADRAEKAMALVDTLSPTDNAWPQVISSLFFSARLTGDHTAVFKKAHYVLEHATDKDVRASMYYNIGLSHRQKGDLEKAKAAFQKAVDENPNGRWTKAAQSGFRDVAYIDDNLKVGSTPPEFTAKSFDGSPISLSAYKGKVVLLEFWATYCPLCAEDASMLKEIYAKYKDKGFTVIGIPLDTELKIVQEVVANKKKSWPQIFDSQGANGHLPKLFRVKGTPTYYVIGRDGKIAAQQIPRSKLAEVIAQVMQK